MDEKLEMTVDKTIEALARIERFVEKYGDKVDKKSAAKISGKLKELNRTVKKLSN